MVDLQWLRSRHPVPHPAQPQTTQNVRWLSFHRGVPRWLWSVWTQVDSDWFHVGRDLMVVALPAGAMADPRWDEPATIPSFGQSLRHGTGWIIPLDSNRGFALGVRRGTPLDAMLARPG